MTRSGSARRQVRGPSLDASSGEARALEATLRFLVPVFGGGVHLRTDLPHVKDPDRVTPVRPASVRGQLREWWRRLYGGGLTLGDLREREASLWGWASRRGAVALEVDAAGLHRADADAEPAYGAFPLRPNGGGAAHGALHRWTGTFVVRLTAERCSEAQWEEVRETFQVWAWFGGFGGRTRRGFGAVEQQPPPPLDPLRWLAERGWRHALGPMVSKASDAHTAALARLRDFRQARGVGRNEGTPAHPGRSRWPEPDAIRRLTGRHANGHAPEHPVTATFPRAAFGMPIVFHFVGHGEPPDQILKPQGHERLASPLLLRPIAVPGGYRPLAVLLPSRRPLDPILRDLQLGAHRVSGLLTGPQQAEVRPLREKRIRQDTGSQAVFEPFFAFFSGK